VVERVNSPELLDHYIDKDITYVIDYENMKPATFLFKNKVGDCDDAANFGDIALSKAGYQTYRRFVYNDGNGHMGLAIKLSDKTFLVAVNFRGGRNRVVGPYKTILEVDQALGYGSRFNNRSSF
jgi:hypothetical protein